jgi:ABC-type nitrate/sulfonate/bicarbonate transport system permease component
MSAQPDDSPALPRHPKKYERVILGTLVVVLFLLFWEGLVRGWWADLLRPCIGDLADHWVVKAIFISSPTRIGTAAYRMFFVTGEIWPDLKASATEYALALLIAIVVGTPLGLAAGWYRRLSYAVAPFLTGLNATPQIALLPIIIVWFGTGFVSKVLIVFLLAVLPIAISAQSGVRTIDPRLIRLASSFGASEWRLFRTIVVPGTVPYLLTGVRLASGRGMIGIVVGEIYGSAAGIGAMINQAGSRFQTDKVFVGILAIVIAGSILAEIVRLVERRVEVWRPPV